MTQELLDTTGRLSLMATRSTSCAVCHAEPMQPCDLRHETYASYAHEHQTHGQRTLHYSVMVLSMENVDMADIHPPLRALVTMLRDHLFDTVDSGDGVTNIEAGMEYALDYSHVFISVKPKLLVSEVDRCRRLLEEHGVQFAPDAHITGMQEAMHALERMPAVVGRYQDGAAFIEVVHITDEHLTTSSPYTKQEVHEQEDR